MIKLLKEEKKFIWLISLILIVITSIPYLYGFLIAGNLHYTGLLTFTFSDGQVYYSLLDQVREGQWLFSNLFTNETNSIPTFNPFWLLVGLVGKFLQLSNFFSLQLFRILLIPLFVLVLYKFVSFFFQKQSIFHKKIAFLFTFFSTGLGGWFFILTKFSLNIENYVQLPMDMWVQESGNFLIILNSPHFIASITLYVLIFYLLMRAFVENKFLWGILAGLAGLVLFIFHPYLVITAYVIPGVFVFLLFFKRLKQGKLNLLIILNYLLYVVISLPSVCYYLYLVINSPFWALRSAQNWCRSTDLPLFFLTLGLSLFFAIGAIIYLSKKKKLTDYHLFLVCWLVLNMLLVYFPVSFQRRLIEGIMIPLTILAFLALVPTYNYLCQHCKFFQRLTKVKIVFLIIIFTALFGLSNWLVYLGQFKILSGKLEFVYVDPAIIKAFNWYKTQTTTNQTILSTVNTGGLIPGEIGRRVFIGHEHETLNYYKKRDQLVWFFTENDEDEAKKQFLADNHLDYVLYSPLEQRVVQNVYEYYFEQNPRAFDPGTKDYLQAVYDQDGVIIYKVNLSAKSQ